MATHLGRNPFQIKSEKNKGKEKPKEKTSLEKKQGASIPVENEGLASGSLFVRIPAASAVFALKTLFFVKGLIHKG